MSHQALRLRVHAFARSMSQRARQLAITAQYAGPATRSLTCVRGDREHDLVHLREALLDCVPSPPALGRVTSWRALRRRRLLPHARARRLSAGEDGRLVQRARARTRRPTGTSTTMASEPALCAVGLPQLEQPRHPRAAADAVTLLRERESDPEHAPDRSVHIAGREVRPVRGIPCPLGFVGPADEPRGQPEIIEILGRKTGPGGLARKLLEPRGPVVQRGGDRSVVASTGVGHGHSIDPTPGCGNGCQR